VPPNLPQGCGNVLKGASPENLEGDPKSRLWVAGAGRVHGQHEQPGQTKNIPGIQTKSIQHIQHDTFLLSLQGKMS
jgi:hypothetical protein